MIKVTNHFYKNYFVKDSLLYRYKYIVLETIDLKDAKTTFHSRFLNSLPKHKICRKTSDPIVTYSQENKYHIEFITNENWLENQEFVLIEIPLISIDDFEFTIIENSKIENETKILFISKYQMLWDKLYISLTKKIIFF